jgi:hypothetical protein
MHQIIHGILFSQRQPCMLEQSFPILIGHAIPVQDPKRNDPDFVLVST